MLRSIAFIGVPFFPIEVARVVNKSLRERPVVVAPSVSGRSRCQVVSREARLHGIRIGTAVSVAQRMCRDLVILQPDPLLYNRAMTAIERLLGNFSPICEPHKPGQIYLDLTGTDWLFGGALPAAQQIRDKILHELRLPVDAGLAINKLVSRVAAIDSEPAGLMEVHFGGEAPFLAPHAVNVLPAADLKTRATLRTLNITYIREVRDIALDTLISALGIPAVSLSRQARGIDPTPVIPPGVPPQLVVAEEFAEDTNDHEALAGIVRNLVIEALSRMRRNQQSARQLVVTLSYSDGKTAVGGKTLRAQSQNSGIWLDVAQEIASRIRTRRTRVHHIELSFRQLARHFEQLNIWQNEKILRNHCAFLLPEESSRASQSTADKQEKLDVALKALEAVQARYGDKALQFGMLT